MPHGTDKTVTTMLEDRSPHDAGARCAQQWVSLSDTLLGGLLHALNNRVTAVSVCVELAAMGDDQMLAGGVLSAEVARLQRVSALIALLPASVKSAEALEIMPVLHDAIALHEHHPRMRAIHCVIESPASLQPVRAPRWALLRLLLVFVDAVKSAADAAALDRVALQLSGDDACLSLRAPSRADGGELGAAMASICDGTLELTDSGLELALPTLLAVRKRERDARAAG